MTDNPSRPADISTDETRETPTDSNDADGDSPESEDSQYHAVPNEEANSGPGDIEVTASTVAELHRRLLAVDGMVNDAETHLTAVSELVTADGSSTPDSGDRAAHAELGSAINKLEQTAEQVAEALEGARTLRTAIEDDGGIERADHESKRTSVFDDEGYVRNTTGLRSEDGDS